MFAFNILGKLIKVLRSAASPNQIAWGYALGTIWGLTPLASLHNLLVLILVAILNVNIAAVMFSFALFSFFAWLLDPLFHSLGYLVLVQIPALQPLWTSLYNAAIAPLTRFNNTIVMGSLVLAVLMLLPNYFFFKWFVRRYRESWNEKIKKWKVTKILTGNKLYNLYLKVKDLGE